MASTTEQYTIETCAAWRMTSGSQSNPDLCITLSRIVSIDNYAREPQSHTVADDDVAPNATRKAGPF
jgi:hypothetical protein